MTKANWLNDDDVRWVKYAIGIVVAFFGAMMIMYNLSTICAPEAYAIHHLIRDIKL